MHTDMSQLVVAASTALPDGVTWTYVVSLTGGMILGALLGLVLGLVLGLWSRRSPWFDARESVTRSRSPLERLCIETVAAVVGTPEQRTHLGASERVAAAAGIEAAAQWVEQWANQGAHARGIVLSFQAHGQMLQLAAEMRRELLGPVVSTPNVPRPVEVEDVR